MTVTQVAACSKTLNGALFSSAVGDADAQPTTGNPLGVWSTLTAQAGVSNATAGLGNRSVRVIEVDLDMPDRPALDIRLSSARSELPAGYKMYWVERIPSLYPDGVVVMIEDAQ